MGILFSGVKKDEPLVDIQEEAEIANYYLKEEGYASIKSQIKRTSGSNSGKDV